MQERPISQDDGELANEAVNPSNLPLEILATIFTHCVEAHSNPFTHKIFDNYYQVSFSKFDCSAPLILSGVCQRWRDIMLNLPELWTSPNVYLNSASKLPLQQEILESWLDNSRTLPLHIGLCSELEGILEPIFDQVKARSSRWETLCLVMSPRNYARFLRGLTSTPFLKSLHLNASQDDTRPNVTSEELPKVALQKSVRLEELYIHGLWPSQVEISIWDNLTVFWTDHGTTNEVLEVLRQAKYLKNGTFHGLYPSHEQNTASLSRNKSLEYLELQTVFTSLILELVLDRLILPSLKKFIYIDEKFIFSTGDSTSMPLAHLRLFFDRSRCELQELVIKGHFLNPLNHEAVEVLQCLPSLRQLSLGSSRRRSLDRWDADEFFTNPATCVTLFESLPQLEVFRVSGARTFSWDALLAFLRLAYSTVTAQASRRVCIELELESDAQYAQPGEAHISRDVALQLAEMDWELNVSLSIRDKTSGDDLLQVSLTHHDSITSTLYQP
ncbi:hypothetical protein CVT26_004799 [Gymnopilus dilepis]|uniref:Uncharacterized protein n=1 Tax=Gymnopilus dilepis TaxID=231916 RepID=A0A409XZM5_9AGAR|nr:hypothetical protein CVT26_004799 [Gymnopilus dilepis]